MGKYNRIDLAIMGAMSGLGGLALGMAATLALSRAVGPKVDDTKVFKEEGKNNVERAYVDDTKVFKEEGKNNVERAYQIWLRTGKLPEIRFRPNYDCK